jgi:hypothetical protein
LIIWQYAPNIIEKAGTLIFIFLSIALTLPLLSLNTLIILIINDPKKVEFSKLGLLSITFASFVSMLTIGGAILIAFLASLPLKTFAYLAVALGFIGIILSFAIGLIGRTVRPNKKLNAENVRQDRE